MLGRWKHIQLSHLDLSYCKVEKQAVLEQLIANIPFNENYLIRQTG
jgi:hypothetical protein